MKFKLKGFSINAFNRDVNNSGDLNDKFAKWAKHRDRISAFITDAQKDNDAQSIIVFGAGECNDIDLHVLADNFKSIILTDVDEEAIRNGLSRQACSKEELAKIEIVQLDYTGFEKEAFFDRLSEQLATEQDIDSICDYVSETVKGIKSNEVPECYKGQFDMAVSCPIYSQLIYTQAEVLTMILSQFNLYDAHSIEKLKQTVRFGMQQIISNYNDLFLSSLKSDGVAVMLTDIIELAKGHPASSAIAISAAQKDTDNKQMEKYVKKYGADFSETGRNDLLKKLRPISEKWSMWPFDTYKDYLVYMVAGRMLHT